MHITTGLVIIMILLIKPKMPATDQDTWFLKLDLCTTCVSVCVCMCLCLFLCLSVCLSVHVCVSAYVCLCVKYSYNFTNHGAM